jgi:hypothetical protein
MKSRRLRAKLVLPPLAGTLALILAVLSSAEPGAPLPPPGPKLAPGETGARLRIFGQPGDPKLENEKVTAVVRSLDGFLVDFYQKAPLLPSFDQLGTTTDIDGLWEIVPVVFLFSTSGTVYVKSKSVTSTSDTISSVGEVTVGGCTFAVESTYRLDRARAALNLATSYRVVSGTPPRDLGLGHLMRWGNVPYFVEGSPGPKRHFSGRTRWVGRSGAGGDLLFRGPPNMWVQFATRVPGFQGAILALDRPGVAVEQTYRFERELSYETIPGAVPAEPRVKPAKILVKVRDELGRPLPAKIRFDRAGSSEPLYPDNGGIEGVDRFCWTGNGSLECEVPPGKYRALVTSGIERDAKRFKFEVASDTTRVLKADLPRVVTTPGWIASDLHLHQVPSVDADISLENRVVSIAAEGVEFAVATDHYVVTDLAPIVHELQSQGVLSAPVATMIGTEISTLGNRFGHFNVFPLDLGENVKYRDVTPSELFADARLKSPDGILQVNHPRWDEKLGYFTRYGLTFDTREPKVAGYDPNFDTLEVYNGDDARDLNLVIPVLLDWMHLLGRGHRYTATGNSDSHNLAFLDPGLPRTYIRHGAGSTDETDVQAPPGSIIRALKAGHVIVTSGPFIDASVGDKGPGETATGTGPKAQLKVRVRAAPWISVSRLEVFEGGNGRLLKSVRIYPNAKPLRYDATIDVPVSKPTFVIVVVRGDVPLPNAARESTLPFAFTNPIWLEP